MFERLHDSLAPVLAVDQCKIASRWFSLLVNDLLCGVIGKAAKLTVST